MKTFELSVKRLQPFISSRNCYTAVKRPVFNVVSNLKEDAPPPGLNLAKHLVSRINISGPLTVADYMKEALTSPGGYYMNNDVFGQKGDFITSPEICQMFGEMIAIWCINELKDIGAPNLVQIVELGPGRGTLAHDLLRVFNSFGFSHNINVHLVEVSPHLSLVQSQKLCLFSSPNIDPMHLHYRSGETAHGVKVFWYRSVLDVPKNFSFVLAHEFFDALPIHKLQKTPEGWRELLVDLDRTEPYKFRYVMSRMETPATKLFMNPTETREHVEVCPDAMVIMEHLAQRFDEDGGFALIADYGHDGDKTDTFRSFKKHSLHNPLEDPGTADLTADVDFSQLRAAAILKDKAITFGPVTQNRFLTQMGIDLRLKALVEKAKPEYIETLKSGYKMMVDDNQMGERFKFFCMFPSVLADHLKEYPVSGFN